MEILMKNIFVCILFVAAMLSQAAMATTYYVRTDGGTSTQCTGLADVAYPGSGTNQACAFNHLYWLLPPSGSSLLKGGDTVIIGQGQYRIGPGEPNSKNCVSIQCSPQVIPSGPSASNPTKIYGKGWDTRTGTKPVLWGSERAPHILNLGTNSNIEIRWLDITDHSSCLYESPDSAKRCNRTTEPFGDYADRGIVAAGGGNVFIKDLDIHGLAIYAFEVGGVSNWTLEDVNMVGNGYGGWNGDIGSNSSTSGLMTFRRVNVKWNGCGEKYPDKNIWGCFSQSQGGYGDGLGTGSTGGDWLFEEVDFSHNTSDGLDLLYHTLGGSVVIKRSRFEGSTGNQIKVAGNFTMENSIVVGDCDYFVGKSFTETQGGTFDYCRAGGNAVVPCLRSGTNFVLINSTVIGNGGSLIMNAGNSSGCVGTEKMIVRNSIFHGLTAYGDNNPVLFNYNAGSGACGGIPIDSAHNIIYNVREGGLCSELYDVLCSNPLFVGPLSGDIWNMNIQSGSPAIGKSNLLKGTTVFGSIVIPSVDVLNKERPLNTITWGAYEFQTASILPPINIRIIP